jgi:DNA polymerase-3 subunit beta
VRFGINKAELVKALKSVQRAVPTRTTKQILYGVLLTAANDQLTVTAYDTELGIQTVIKATDSPTLDIVESGAIVLTARYLIEIVQKLPSAGVMIDSNGVVATIASGKSTFTLNGMDYREYPILPEMTSQYAFPLPVTEFKDLIRHTAFATTDSEVRPTLTGVLINISGDNVTFTATDSHRLALQSKTVVLLADQTDVSMIVPAKSLEELDKIMNDEKAEATIQLAFNQMLIQFQNTSLYTRLIEGNYPDVSRIIPTSFVTEIEVDGEEFNNCIDRASLLAKDNENQGIIINVDPVLEITARSSEIGKVTETVGTKEFKGQSMKLGCNARFLMEALKALGNVTVHIGFTGTGSAFVLWAKDDESQKHLVLPVRI